MERTKVTEINQENIHKSRIKLLQYQSGNRTRSVRVQIESYNSFYGQNIFLMAPFYLTENIQS